MANYNTFIAQETKGGKTMLVTSSARKVKSLLAPGIRVEVWSENKKVETVYTKTVTLLEKYVLSEKQYIREKQARAEKRNKLRRARANERQAR
jgi:uncharacterized protein (DUF302 family)